MDPELQKIADHLRPDIKSLAYEELPCQLSQGKSTVTFNGKSYTLSVFGPHNLQNLNGARLVCAELGITDDQFFECISTFKGAAKRLQTLRSEENAAVFLDFAHSPSKLEATVKAVKQQFPDRKLVACMELHTFSSLNKDFLPHYKNTMREADIAYVYFNPKVVEHKKLPPITEEMVLEAFGTDNVTVFSDTDKLQQTLRSLVWRSSNLLLMSSGNFSGIDFKKFAEGLF